MAVLIFKQGNYTETGSLAYAEPIFFTDANTLIISGGVSTYTNTEVTPSISAGRVGYRVATIDSINTGSFLVSGDVSASNLFLDGNATVRGNITMGGSGLDFGDASDDNVVFKADISSSFIPNNDDSFDLGSDSQRWKTAYFSNLNLSGSLYVIGGPIDLHSDTYISASSGTFTHLDVGSYLDVDVTGNTTFDGQGTLSVSSSGALKIDSPTSIGIGTNSDAPIDIDSTTLDIDSSGDITIDASNSKIAIAAGTTASLDGEEGIHIGLEERVPVRIEGNSVTINGSANVDVDADGGKLTLDGSTGIDIGVEADVPIDVDSSTLDIDASGAITISGSGVFDVNAAGALTLDSDTSISIGTDKDKPIDIDASTFDVDASGALTLDSATSISIGTNADKPIDIDSTTLDIDSSGAITINGESTTAISSSGALSIDSETGINIGTTSDKPIDIDSTTLDIDASGAVTVDSTSTISLDGVGNSNFTIDSGNLTINNTTSGNMTLQSAGAIDIDADGGKITIDGSSGIDIGVESDVAIDVDSSTFDLDASGNITLDSTTGINIGTANSGVAISIGHTTSETTVNDNLTITGNLTVNGETTYVSSSNVTIGDRIIELNYLGATGNGGLYVGDADGTLTSGSLLWDSTNDYWIAGAKDSEHKIMLSNGDSVISGSGTNNQVALFNSTHGLDSDGNLTFDGSTLGVTGNVTASASGSFNDIKVTDTIRANTGSFGHIVTDTIRANSLPNNSSELTAVSIKEDGQVGTTELGTTSLLSNLSATQLDLDDNQYTTTLTAGELNFYDNDTSIIVSQSLGKIGFRGSDDASGLPEYFEGAQIDVRSRAEWGSAIYPASMYFNVRAGGSGGAMTNVVEINSDNVILHSNISGSSTSITGSFGKVIGSIAATNGVISGSSQVVLGSILGFNTYTGSVDTEQSAQNTRLDQLSTETGSISNEQTTQNGRLTSLEAATGSYLTSSGSVDFDDITDKPGYLVSNLVPGSNVTITSGSGTLTIASAGGGGGGGVGTLQQVTTSGSATNVAVTFSNGTDAPNKSTGSVVIEGGLAVSKSLHIGTELTVDDSTNGGNGLHFSSDTLTLGNTTESGASGKIELKEEDNGTTAVIVNGNNNLSLSRGSANVLAHDGTKWTFEGTVDSTSKTTGTVVISGGLGVNNTINAGGDVIAYASSDERLKDNIKPIENPLEKISQISGNTFDWNNEKQNIYNGKDYGVIAQEIQKVMPELVDTRDNGYLAVKYEKIVPLLIESIKELKKEIEELKSK